MVNDTTKHFSTASLAPLCQTQFGVLSHSFLCESISSIMHTLPVTSRSSSSLSEILDLLQQHRIGSILLVSDQGKLEGIFTDRDVLIKNILRDPSALSSPVQKYMTSNVVSALPTTPIIEGLNLMSHGGFRHLPIVDEELIPIGIVSVKNVIDALVARFVSDIEQFTPYQEDDQGA